jgi:phage FluMu protein Com
MINNTSAIAAQVARVRVREYRCKYCGRMFFKAYIPQGVDLYIEVQCPNSSCKRKTIIEKEEKSNVDSQDKRPMPIPLDVGTAERAILPGVVGGG